MGLVREHGGVILQSSPLYDFCKVEQRGEWIRILVALIEFLRSGESKVGYLNKTLGRNMIHKAYSPPEKGTDVQGRFFCGCCKHGISGDNEYEFPTFTLESLMRCGLDTAVGRSDRKPKRPNRKRKRAH